MEQTTRMYLKVREIWARPKQGSDDDEMRVHFGRCRKISASNYVCEPALSSGCSIGSINSATSSGFRQLAPEPDRQLRRSPDVTANLIACQGKSAMIILLEKIVHAMLLPGLMAWLLMVISLFAQLGKRSRIAIATNIIAVAILWLAGNTIVCNMLVRMLEMQYVPSGDLPHADAIVLLAGVTGRAYPPQPVPHLGPGADRLVYAATLYKEGKARLLFLSGDRSESADMGEVLEMMGVPRTAMIGEQTDLQNTYGSARDLKAALVSHNVSRVLLVTSAIRMPRALAVFRSLGIDVIAAPTDFSTRTTSTLQAQNIISAVFPMGDNGRFAAAIHEIVGFVSYKLVGWI
jgi:uncharacterized SAM-binding protein YcdF (DUF218 family)